MSIAGNSPRSTESEGIATVRVFLASNDSSFVNVFVIEENIGVRLIKLKF